MSHARKGSSLAWKESVELVPTMVAPDANGTSGTDPEVAPFVRTDTEGN